MTSAATPNGSEVLLTSPRIVPADTGSESLVMVDTSGDKSPYAGSDATAGDTANAGALDGEGGAGAGGAGRQARAGSSARSLRYARYRDAPSPAYPESARRAGREGRVLLRVLVDESGRSQEVEISRSSGSEALDRAAAEAIWHWRFDPAQYGEQPVASWLRIPVEFRLTEAGN